MKVLLLAALASIGAHGPKMTTMLGTDAVLDCPFASGVACETAAGPDVAVTTTRSGGATCIGGAVVGANEACVSADGLECMASGVGGRTAADVHTVSTAGFPVASGEIRLQYTPAAAITATTHFLLSAETFGVAGWSLYVRDTTALTFIVANGAGGNYTHTGSALTWTAGQTYDIRVVWGGTSVKIWRDGALVTDSGGGLMPLGPLPATGNIGGRTPSGANPAHGSIRILRVGA